MADHPNVALHGNCQPKYQAVADALQENFKSGDLGASVAVIDRGELVVDLWGGSASRDGQRPWQHDTVVNLWSTTKTIAALVTLLLDERSELSVEQSVASVWPEFGAAGKDEIRIRHVLSHTAGLPTFDPPISHDEMFDPLFCAERIAAQRPDHAPGERFAYHAFTQGVLLGEIVRRVTGRTMGQWIREELTGPTGIDFHLGVPDDVLPRVAEMRTDGMPPANDGPDRVADVNTDRWRRSEFPASNGHGNARSVANLLSLLTRTPAVSLPPVTSSRVARILEVQWDGPDPITGGHVKMGIGFGHNSPATPIGINDQTVFWAGLGGSMAVVDLANDLVCCYAMNRMIDGAEGGIRAVRVMHAAHRSRRA